jgi:hypothetical protein
MPFELQYKPPEIKFDDRLEGELAREVPTEPYATIAPSPYVTAGNNPFVDYGRILTPEGGILIFYRDQAIGWVYTLLRIAAGVILTLIQFWLLIDSSLSDVQASIAFWALLAGTIFLVTRKIKKRHSVEIRHDRMILDGKHVFWAQHIGAYWPQLQRVENDPNRMVIAGICGTRFVEFMTANRMDDNDRTPEVLIVDLHDAMRQLWGRNELVLS